MENYPVKGIYTPSEAAFLCGMNLEQFMPRITSGSLPSFPILERHIRIRHKDLQEYIEREGIVPPHEWRGQPVNYKVLLVEDDPDLLELISEVLKDESYIDVRAEDNGFTAGLQIAGWKPDLILLDFLMPGINGFGLCRKLRNRSETSDLPIMAVTALNSIEDKRLIFESGASDFLGKPFHSDDLIRKVRVLLGLEDSSPDDGRQAALRPKKI